ncbi:hypothetical protein FPOAC1_008368 [Fusarium poae]|uniref:hypothetical protein n=1 Tax=Fusarium poae TaxID=36050 RepID=UPI001CE8E000|nr:hypothetical protein FPOAC1_008368 [Fusarium poae]KAG8668983.1 hypothetical protein FPOAC1_008368 [Fusarium poae]
MPHADRSPSQDTKPYCNLREVKLLRALTPSPISHPTIDQPLCRAVNWTRALKANQSIHCSIIRSSTVALQRPCSLILQSLPLDHHGSFAFGLLCWENSTAHQNFVSLLGPPVASKISHFSP